MRVSKEKAAENRERILKAASALMRERGITGVGVDALSDAAGLTHGSVYSQFGSKDALAEEALRFALASTAANLDQDEDLKGYVTRYLSNAHRDAPGKGCAIAALGCEMPRSSQSVRSAFTDGFRRMATHVSKLTGERSSRKQEEAALAVLATMVGALILSRAVDDTELADKILSASRKALTPSVGGVF